MFKKLLVPLDGTPQSNVALHLARVLAEGCRGHLVLMRVVDTALLAPEERVQRPALALQQLKRIAKELRQPGIEVDVRVSTGEVVTEILRLSDVEHVDALIVATHMSSLEHLVDDSTTGSLIARTRLPVFVVRPGGRRIRSLRTVLVAVDRSPGGAQSLDEAVNLARLTGAAIVLVTVVTAPEHFGFDPLLAITLGARQDRDAGAQAVAEDYVNEIARKLAAHGLEATAKVLVGFPAEQILAAADQEDADLIVMSTHGYQVPLRILLGSTAHEIVRAAHRPVLLVRRRDGVGPQPGPSSASPATIAEA